MSAHRRIAAIGDTSWSTALAEQDPELHALLTQLSGAPSSRPEAMRRLSRLLTKRRRQAIREGAKKSPLDWRAQHDPLGEGQPAARRAAAGETTRDFEGAISSPGKALDLVAMLRKRKAIGPRQEKAARAFQDDWEEAHLDPLHAPDLERTPGLGGGEHVTVKMLRARNTVWAAVERMGGYATPLGSAAWNVLGNGESLKEFALRFPWANERTVKGLVIGACDALAAFYGY